jgi:hypothetical protein
MLVASCFVSAEGFRLRAARFLDLGRFFTARGCHQKQSEAIAGFTDLSPFWSLNLFVASPHPSHSNSHSNDHSNKICNKSSPNS